MPADADYRPATVPGFKDWARRSAAVLERGLRYHYCVSGTVQLAGRLAYCSPLTMFMMMFVSE